MLNNEQSIDMQNARQDPDAGQDGLYPLKRIGGRREVKSDCDAIRLLVFISPISLSYFCSLSKLIIKRVILTSGFLVVPILREVPSWCLI